MSDEVFISPDGLDKLKEELAHRSTILRKEISTAIGVAKEQGDLSENFEYQDAKERQGENEVRIANVENMITNAILVESKLGSDMVSLGVTFNIETSTGDKKTFEMVGSTEADPLSGKISNESPLGNLFLGKRAGESVEMTLPSGTVTYKILSID